MAQSTPDTLGSRIKNAMMIYAQRNGGHTSPAEFGEAVTKELGIAAPFSAETVFGWMNDKIVPNFQTSMAIATLGGHTTDVQRGWLAYGAEGPIHALDDRDYDRFHKRAGAIKAFVV
jgi:hypothetical protein